MMFTELSEIRVLEGTWLELRNSKGLTVGLFPMVESPNDENEYVAVEPVVLAPGNYEVTIFNDSSPLVDDCFSVRSDHILFSYRVEYHPQRIVSVTKSMFKGTEEEWWEYLEMEAEA